MADRPRSIDEVVAAEDPAERERFDRAKNYRDRAVEDFHADVWLVADRQRKASGASNIRTMTAVAK